jgi:hypothetical protein
MFYWYIGWSQRTEFNAASPAAERCDIVPRGQGYGAGHFNGAVQCGHVVMKEAA